MGAGMRESHTKLRAKEASSKDNRKNNARGSIGQIKKRGGGNRADKKKKPAQDS